VAPVGRMMRRPEYRTVRSSETLGSDLNHPLPFLEHVHAYAPDYRSVSSLKRLESALGTCEPLDGSEEKGASLAVLIHRPIQIAPLPFALAIRLVHAPADPHGPLTAMQGFLALGPVLHHPALDGRVLPLPPSFPHQFFDMPIAQGIGEDISARPCQ
jgi:hypothetical protein